MHLAYINAAYQSGKNNAIDAAILTRSTNNEKEIALGQKVAEILFNFEERKSSCIIPTEDGAFLLICKGASEEIMTVCSSVRFGGQVHENNEKTRATVGKLARELNMDGYRVILVATRVITNNQPFDNVDGLDVALTLEGLLIPRR